MVNDAIPAATLILVRQRARDEPELLMVTRSQAMAFAPGALVFPGGRIDPGDAAMAAAAGLDDGAARIAAIRETIEECAVGAGLEPSISADQALAMQQALDSGGDFAELLRRNRVEVDPSGLTPFARWVPGHEVRRRFDTLFFLAKASATDLDPSVSGEECESAGWISARRALDLETRGEVRLIYPTRKNLERLAQFNSYEEMREDALAHPIAPITAWIERRGEEEIVRIPDGLGYQSTTDPLAAVWRG